MRLSQSFTKTLRDVSQDETAKSTQYLLRAGYIHKEMAGVYSFLPLGLKIIENIKSIIRDELNQLGCQELLLTALQSPDPWIKTGRWDDKVLDVWFKTTLAAGGELGLAPTHEEAITNLMREYVSSYKDLPFSAYQFQTKFRNELRAKSGILRTREFIMKDLYNFAADAESHQIFYNQVSDAYMRIYEKVGLGDCTMRTFASGGSFARYSHEFQTILPIGEDTIYYNADKSIALNEEVLNDEVLEELHIKREELTATSACEVGNIFTLSEKYSAPLGLVYNTREGERKNVFMGCYGIGISRLMGVIAEKFADERGLIWPQSIAPYQYYLIAIGERGTKIANELYEKYPNVFLYDDRDLRPGAKFADAELMGIPNRLVISDKTLENNQLELTDRATGQSQFISLDNHQNLLDF